MQIDADAVERLKSSLDQLIERSDELALSKAPPLPPEPPNAKRGGGGGDMEPRIAKLEAHMEHVRDDLTKLRDVPVQLGNLTTKVDNLPTKEWTFKTLAALLVALSVIVGLIVRFVPHAN